MTDTSAEPDPVPTIEVGELLRAADRGEPMVLLDVRNEDEARAWAFEARRAVATVRVPYFDFIEDEAGSISKIPSGRDVAVICAHGGSSEMVARLLAEAGVPARHVTGGMVAYGEYLEPVAVPLDAGEASRFAVWQINRRGKGCLSYVVASGGEAVVVDPSRNIAWFADFAARQGLRVTRVLDTHVHADHVSGGPALAAMSGAPYSVSAGPGLELHHPVLPLDDGQMLWVGGQTGAGIAVGVLFTPGHTPGSISYLVDGRYLLTGDTLFTRSVGRPDLGGKLDDWGRTLFTSITGRLAPLPDEVVVLPAHYAGAHEIDANGVVSARLGHLRRTVPELRCRSADAFVASIRAGVREPPAAYEEITRVNLGVGSPESDAITQWELGRNECAVSGRHAGAGRPER